CKILSRDLRFAGIPKRDERGRTLDVHALRHTFGTLLSRGGVAPRTAQAAMRHSKLELTMNVYTDPKLLDVRGTLGALPALLLPGSSADEREAARGYGGDGRKTRTLAPTLAPTPDNLVQAGASAGKVSTDQPIGPDVGALATSASGDKRKDPLTAPVSGCL